METIVATNFWYLGYKMVPEAAVKDHSFKSEIVQKAAQVLCSCM